MTRTLRLDDVDTAFPRSDSIRLYLILDDGTVQPATTNMGLDEFRREYTGKKLRCAYYEYAADAPERTITEVVDAAGLYRKMNNKKSLEGALTTR